MRRESFLDAMRGVPVVVVASSLGLSVRRVRGASGGAFGPCPACGAERRHSKSADRRLACGVRSDGRGFRCFQCDISGDAASLVALVIGGAPLRELSPHRLADVRAWCERFTGGAFVPPAAVEHERRIADAGSPTLDAAELATFWESCVPVTEDAEVSAFLRDARGIDPEKVAAEDGARALPIAAAVPRWAWCRGAWSRTGRRLIVPMLDATGRLLAFRARLVRTATEGEPKSAGPKGGSCRGTVFANRLALALLCGELVACSAVLISEGEMDTLAASVAAQDHPEPLAVFGIVQGSFTPEIAARIPSTARVVIATHHDEQGDKYAATIRAALPHSQNVARTRPAQRAA